MMCFNDIYDKESRIEYLENCIMIDKLLNAYLTESDILYMNIFTESEIEAVEKKKENGFISFIKRITEAVTNMLHNLATAISSSFGKSNNMTSDDFLNSELGKTVYAVDISKINKECDDKILQGRKIIQAISNGTGVDDHLIAQYADGAANFLNKNGGTMLATGATIISASKAREWINKKLGLMKSTDETLRSIASDSLNKETQSKLAKVYSSMGKHVSKFQSVATDYFKILTKYKGNKNKSK